MEGVKRGLGPLLPVVLLALVVACLGSHHKEGNVVVMDQNIDKASGSYGIGDKNATVGHSDGEKLDKHDEIQQQENSEDKEYNGAQKEDKRVDHEEKETDQKGKESSEGQKHGPENRQDDNVSEKPIIKEYDDTHEENNIWATAGNGTNCGKWYCLLMCIQYTTFNVNTTDMTKRNKDKIR